MGEKSGFTEASGASGATGASGASRGTGSTQDGWPGGGGGVGARSVTAGEEPISSYSSASLLPQPPTQKPSMGGTGLFNLPRPVEHHDLQPQAFNPRERESLAPVERVDSSVARPSVINPEAELNLPAIRLHKQRDRQWVVSLNANHWILTTFDKLFLLFSLIVTLLGTFWLVDSLLYIEHTNLGIKHIHQSAEIKRYINRRTPYMDDDKSPNCSFCISKNLTLKASCPSSPNYTEEVSDKHNHTAVFGPWSECNATCGKEGFTSRQVRDPDEKCDPGTQWYPCNRFACPLPPTFSLHDRLCNDSSLTPAQTWLLPNQAMDDGDLHLVNYSQPEDRIPRPAVCCSLPGFVDHQNWMNDPSEKRGAILAFLRSPKNLLEDSDNPQRRLFQPLVSGGNTCSDKGGLVLPLLRLDDHSTVGPLSLPSRPHTAWLSLGEVMAIFPPGHFKPTKPSINASHPYNCLLDPTLTIAKNCKTELGFRCAINATAATTPNPPSPNPPSPSSPPNKDFLPKGIETCDSTSNS